MTEVSTARQVLFDQLMRVPHKVYGPMVAALRQAMGDDPDFIARACVHLNRGGSSIRDQQDAGIISLLQAPNTYPEYREAGRCLLLGSDVYPTIQPDRLTGLEPFRILRVWHHLVSRHIISHRDGEAERFATRHAADQSLARIAGRLSKGGEQVEPGALKISKDTTPMPSRLIRSLMHDWFAFLEQNHRRADGVVVGNRKLMARVCRYHHFSDDEFPYLRALLYAKEPPADSKVAIIKQIAKSDDPREQARLAIEHKIPYLTLASVVGKVHPVLGIALVERMTPTQALNARAWVERSGLLNMPAVKEVYVAKVAQATKSVASVKHRKSARGTDTDVEAATVVARDRAHAKAQRIERRTALCIDKSQSMRAAIEIGKEFGAHIAPLCDELMLVLFDDYARQVNTQGATTLSEWEGLFRGVRATGGTSMTAAWDVIQRSQFQPEQIVFVTDGGERHHGRLSDRLARMEEPPHVVVIRVPGADPDWLTERLRGANLRVDKFEVSTLDYYLFDQVAALLGGPPALTLVECINEVVLPYRAKESSVPEVL